MNLTADPNLNYTILSSLLEMVKKRIILNNELYKINDWLSSNKLSLNVRKPKYMVLHTPQRKGIYPTFILNNVN